MGKGDKKTGKGKRFMGSRGNTRPKTSTLKKFVNATEAVVNEIKKEIKEEVKTVKKAATKKTKKTEE